MLKIAIEQLIGGWLSALPKLLTPSAPTDWPVPKVLHVHLFLFLGVNFVRLNFPHTLQLDFFLGGLPLQPTLQIIGPDVKLLVWWSSAVAALYGHLSEHDIGKIAAEIHADEAKRDGRSLEDIMTAVSVLSRRERAVVLIGWMGDKVVVAGNGTDRLKGTVVKIPGAPDMYDHEVGAPSLSLSSPLFPDPKDLACFSSRRTRLGLSQVWTPVFSTASRYI